MQERVAVSEGLPPPEDGARTARPRGAVLALGALALQLGCRSDPTTEVLVSICWDQLVAADLTRLEVRAATPGSDASLPSLVVAVDEIDAGLGTQRPASLSLVPSAGERDFRLVVTALAGRRPIAEYRADAHFEHGRRRAIDVVLEASCYGQLCRSDAEQRLDRACVAGRCVDVPQLDALRGVDTPETQRCPPSSEPPDAGTEEPSEAGADTGADGRHAASMDAGTGSPDATFDAHVAARTDATFDDGPSDAGAGIEPPPDADAEAGLPESDARADASDVEAEDDAGEHECVADCLPGACVPWQGDDFVCSCPDGYGSLDGRSCDDVDECTALAVECMAPQVCINEPGSFRCGCTGYYSDHPSDPALCEDRHFVALQSYGSTDSADCNDVASNADAEIFIAGRCSATCTLDGFPHPSFGGDDILLARLDADGHRLWSAVFGGSGNDLAYAIEALPDGGFVAAGQGVLDDLDFGLGPPNGGADRDGWVVAFDPDGQPLWQFVVASAGFDTVRGLAVDRDGSLVIAGRHSGPLSFGALALPHAGGEDFFVMRLDPQGNPIWMRGFGGMGQDAAGELRIDSHGDIYVTTFFQSSIRIDTEQYVTAGTDSLLVKLDSAGNVLRSSLFAAGGDCKLWSLAVDDADNIYVSGQFAETASFPGGPPYVSQGLTDTLLAKFTRDGRYLWSFTYGGADFDSGYDIALTSEGNLFLLGAMRGDIEVGGTLLPGRGANSADVLLATLSPDGNVLWAHNFGGASTDVPRGLVRDANGDIVACGRVDGPASLLSGEGYIAPTGRDAYVLKLRP